MLTRSVSNIPSPARGDLTELWVPFSRECGLTCLDLPIYADALRAWALAEGLTRSLIVTQHATFSVAGRGLAGNVSRVDAEFQNLVGSHMSMGRGFVSDDFDPSATPVAILSYDTWRSLGLDSTDTLGKSIDVGGVIHLIGGVARPGVNYPLGTYLWSSSTIRSDSARTRLLLGGSVDRCQDFMQLLRFETLSENREFVLREPRLGFEGIERFVQAAQWFTGLMLVLAIIAAVGLTIDRQIRSIAEYAVSVALGASRYRVMLVFVVETVLLVTGIAFASVIGTIWLLLIAKSIMPALAGFHLDINTHTSGWFAVPLLLIVVGVCLVVSGFLAIPQVAVADALRGHLTQFRRSSRLRSISVVVQVSLTIAIVQLGAVTLGSFMKLQTASVGFDPSDFVVGLVDLPNDQVNNAGFIAEELRNRLRQSAGEQSTVWTEQYPRGHHSSSNPAMVIDGGRTLGMTELPNGLLWVDNSFFRTVLGDRQANLADESAVIVNEAARDIWWPDGEAVGRRIQLLGPNILTVIGVIPNFDTSYRGLRYAFLYGMWPHVYRRMPSSHSARRLQIMVHVSDRPLNSVIDIVRDATAAVGSGLVLSDLDRLDNVMRRYGGFGRLIASSQLVSIGSFFAIMIALVGLLAIVGAQLLSKKKDLAVMTALGAPTHRLLSAVVGPIVPVLVGGALCGSIVARFAVPYVGALLPRGSSVPITTAFVVSSLFVAIALLAAIAVGWHVRRANPIRELGST